MASQQIHVLRHHARSGRRATHDPNAVHVCTVLFPKSSAEIIDNWHVVGLRGTGSGSRACCIVLRAA
jgi:hypothetical protein